MDGFIIVNKCKTKKKTIVTVEFKEFYGRKRKPKTIRFHFQFNKNLQVL